MDNYYTKLISFEAFKTITEAGYVRLMENLSPYSQSGKPTVGIMGPGYYTMTVAEAIDWFIGNGIYIDLGLETMAEPSWSWTVSFMGDKWKRVHDKKGSVMGCLDGSVDSFDVCANSAIIAACNMLIQYKEI